MKKTQILEALRTIRKQKVSYISIVLIAFLAVTCFSGISFSAKGISESGSTYYDRQNFRDLEIVSAVMFTDSDLEAIRNLEGVKDAEGMLRTSGKLVAAGEKRTVSVLSPTERINLPQILEGAVPTKETEIAVEKELLAALKIKIGDTVSLEDTGAMKLLKNTEYTVVASFIHPDHLSTPNRFGDYVMVSKDAFDSTILSGRSLYAEIVVEKPEGINRFNDEYAEIISAYLRPLEELSVTCSKNSLESLWSQIAEYRNILRNDMVRPLLLSLIMIVKDCSPEEAEALLEKAQWAADELIPDLSKTDISARVIPILNDFSITLPDKENLVRSLVDQIRAHADKLSAFGIRLDAFSITDEMVDKMQETLNKFDLSLYDKLIAATDFWNEGHARYLKTVEHLLQSDSSDKEFTGVWVPFDARMNAAFTHMEMSVKGISTIAVRFTLLFVLVGAIVIYATVGKLVDEQKKLVGATKAFGFYNREVFGKYLIFGGSATLIGTVLGLLAGTFLLQLFIDYAYGRNYVSDFPDRTVIVWQIVVMVVAAVLLAFAAVLFASIKLIRSTAVSLMQGDVPTGMKKGKAGKKSRLSLYQRLILRNMKTDSKRVFVTVISIAGCCALMLIGFSVYMSVRETVRVQFEEVVRYDSSVHVEAAKAAEASEAVSGVLDGIGASSLPVYLESGAFRSGEAVDPAEFVVADPEKLSGYLNLYDAETGEPLKTDGLLIPYSYAATYSLKVGDSCVLMDKAGAVHSAVIDGIFKSQLGQTIVIGPKSYQKIFGAEPQTNAFLVNHPGTDREKLEELLKPIDGFESVIRSDSLKVLFDSFSDLLAIMMVILITAAGLMSAVILSNLVNICILQKKRELTIMRVNGFTTKEVKNYITREAVLTSIVGVLLGTGLGLLQFRSIMPLLGKSYTSFIMTPNWIAILVSAAITIFFTLVIYRFALRKVKNLKLSDVA